MRHWIGDEYNDATRGGGIKTEVEINKHSKHYIGDFDRDHHQQPKDPVEQRPPLYSTTRRRPLLNKGSPIYSYMEEPMCGGHPTAPSERGDYGKSVYLNVTIVEEMPHEAIEEIPNKSISVSTACFKYAGMWIPRSLNGWKRILYHCFTMLSFVFTVGIYLVTQMVALFTNLGNIPAMTEVGLLFFTNLALSAKMFNLVFRRKKIEIVTAANLRDLNYVADNDIRNIVIRCNAETWFHQKFYIAVTCFTCTGWVISSPKGELLMKAWYPYDTNTSPYYELTYIHQTSALFLSAIINVCMDSLVVALIAQVRCRLLVVRHMLTRLTEGLEWSEDTELIVEEHVASSRLRDSVRAHQTALELAAELEACFSTPTLAQFTVSLFIICVTAFQLALATDSVVIRLVSMGTYLLDMMFQVFIYCWHGNQLTLENMEVLQAAYGCSWYRCSSSFRRTLLTLTTRCFRPLQLTVGGFAALSLRTFMAIMKISYSFFSLLQQVDEETRSS